MRLRTAPALAGIAVALAAPFVVGAVGMGSASFAPAYLAALGIAAYAVMRRRRAAVIATLALVSIAVLATILDLALRALTPGPPVLIARWPELPIVHRFTPNAAVDLQFADLAQMMGSTPADAPTIHVVTDARGFRNDPAAARDGIDIVLTGDSVGSGATSNDETIRGFLARDFGVRPLDLSVPASGPWHEYVNFSLEVDHFTAKPGAVLAWLLNEGNDLDDEFGPLEWRAPPWNATMTRWLNETRAWRSRSPLRRLGTADRASEDVLAAKLPDGRPILFYKPYLRNAARDAATVRAHPNYPKLRATLVRGAALARERGMRAIIFILPTKGQVYAWVHQGVAPWAQAAAASGFTRALLDLCSEERLECVDVMPGLVAEAKRAMEADGSLLYWPLDTHPNPAGNRYFARRIREAIAAR